MEVDQSPVRGSLDAGAGKAAALDFGTEAAAELSAVTIRRLGAVYVPPVAGGPVASGGT